MPLDFTHNIVPQNNLRLPDALTVKYGPARLLSRFILEGDKAARRKGVELRLRHDFAELAYVNKQRIAHGDWYQLPNIFNSDYADLQPENSYWISGEDEYGEVVLTQAGRIYHWPETTLVEEASAMFYASRDQGRRCVVTAPQARSITGAVFYGGCGWVRPDFRGRQLMQLVPRVGRAYALARWPVDWGISLVVPILVDKGVAAGYGYKHTSYSVCFPASPWGDIEFALVSISAEEAYDDFASIMWGEGDAAESVGATTVFEKSVTRVSSDLVFQGSSSRS
jgi:hypothetical protein